MKNKEVELKFRLENLENVKKFLNSKSKPIFIDQYQKDVYFNPPHKNFLSKKPIAEWLRLRETDNGASINYKNWHIKEGDETVSCDEHETSIDNFDNMLAILVALNFSQIVVVEKHRTSWKIEYAEISIDEVKNLGAYIEIEAKGKFDSIEKAKEYIYEFADQIGAKLGDQDFRGYPFRILEQKGYKF